MRGRSVRSVYRQIAERLRRLGVRRLGVSVSRTKPSPGSTATPGPLRSTPCCVWVRGTLQHNSGWKVKKIQLKQGNLCHSARKDGWNETPWRHSSLWRVLTHSRKSTKQTKSNMGGCGGENLSLNRWQGDCGTWKAMSTEEKAIRRIIVLPDSGSGLSSPENRKWAGLGLVPVTLLIAMTEHWACAA